MKMLFGAWLKGGGYGLVAREINAARTIAEIQRAIDEEKEKQRQQWLNAAHPMPARKRK